MKNTRTEYIAYGDGQLPVDVPEWTRTIVAKPPMPPVPDIEGAVREALANPIAHEPLHKLVGPSSKVTISVRRCVRIVFPDQEDGLSPDRYRGDRRGTA